MTEKRRTLLYTWIGTLVNIVCAGAVGILMYVMTYDKGLAIAVMIIVLAVWLAEDTIVDKLDDLERKLEVLHERERAVRGEGGSPPRVG